MIIKLEVAAARGGGAIKFHAYLPRIFGLAALFESSPTPLAYSVASRLLSSLDEEFRVRKE